MREKGGVTGQSLESTMRRAEIDMPPSANQVLALAEELRETFAAQTVDRNAVNLLVHDALMKALDVKLGDIGRGANEIAETNKAA
jgi:hypothetical protein